jgi:hypothetical protein
MVSTCSFRTDAASTPIPIPTCPFINQGLVEFRLADPNKPGSVCTAEVHARIEPGGPNQTHILWDAQELENEPTGGCRNVGPEYVGDSTVDGPCCERIVDISLPLAKQSFRMLVRTDWTDNVATSSATAGSTPLELRLLLRRDPGRN